MGIQQEGITITRKKGERRKKGRLNEELKGRWVG
jgi:hypothetical protein